MKCPNRKQNPPGLAADFTEWRQYEMSFQMSRSLLELRPAMPFVLFTSRPVLENLSGAKWSPMATYNGG